MTRNIAAAGDAQAMKLKKCRAPMASGLNSFWNCWGDLRSLRQALCTEASLHALRRRYPQIYDSDEKLLIDPGTIAVEHTDFESALSAITPASHRSAAAHARSIFRRYSKALTLMNSEIENK